MKKISNILHSISEKIFIISMILVLLSAIFYNRVSIDGHIFSLPAFFSIFSFLSVFILFTVTSSNSSGEIHVHGWKKHIISMLILLCTGFAFYLGIYTPFNSRLVLEMPIQQEVQISSVSFSAETNEKYFIEVDSRSFGRGINTILKLSVSNETWKNDFETTIFDRISKKRSNNVTTRINLPFVFPENGNYIFTVEQNGNLLAIKKIRLFVRE